MAEPIDESRDSLPPCVRQGGSEPSCVRKEPREEDPILDLHSLVSCRISTDGEQLQFALKKGYGLLVVMNYVFSSSYVTSKTKDREMPTRNGLCAGSTASAFPTHEYVNTEENREAILCFSSNRGGPIVTHDIVGRKTGIFVFRDTFLAASSACKHRIEECWPGKYTR